jgi:hypothetical protein
MSSAVKWQDFFTESGKKERRKEKGKKEKMGKQKVFPFHMIHTN